MRRIAFVAALGFGLAACSDVPVAPGTALAPAPATFAQASDGVPIPGHYIVRFNDDEQDVDGKAIKLATKHVGKIKYLYKSALKGMALELADAEVAALRADPAVLSVEQDQTVSISTGTRMPLTSVVGRFHSGLP